MIYTISFHCKASCRFFIKRNCVHENEIIERGSTYIKVNESFMKGYDWINSSYVYQINKN